MSTLSGIVPRYHSRKAPLAKVLAGGQSAPGVACLSITTTPARFVIPAAWAGRFVRITPVGGSVDILCGGAAVAVVDGQTSTVTAEAIATHASTGDHIPAATSDLFLMPADRIATHFAVVGSASLKLYIRLTE